jgi:hypothetical protein
MLYLKKIFASTLMLIFSLNVEIYGTASVGL